MDDESGESMEPMEEVLTHTLAENQVQRSVSSNAIVETNGRRTDATDSITFRANAVVNKYRKRRLKPCL